MKATLSKLAAPFVDLLFPASCAGCGRGGSFLCVICEAGLPRLERPYCTMCAAPGPGPCSWCRATPLATDGIRALYLFDGPVQKMVYSLKYQGIRALAPDLGRLLAHFLESNALPFDVLIPVPLHRRRERARGYNQAELLARELGKRSGMPLDTRTLRRTQDTPPQVSLKSHEARRENIQGAFEADAGAKGQRVLLIDDVVTTGSTMSACGAALKAAGVHSVWGLALARQA